MKRSLSSQAALALVCQLALLAPGCIVTDTGNPYQEPDDGEHNSEEGTAGGACDEVATDVELDEVTALGFSAGAIVALLPSEQVYDLAWSAASGLEYGPENGTVQLTLRVVPLGGARLIDRSPATNSDGGGLLVESLDGCRDSLQLDVRVQLETSGGALLESIDTRVEAYAADFASGSFNLDLDDVAGSFEAQVQAPANMQLTRASLQGQLGFSEYGAVGSLRLYTELRSNEGGAVGQSSGGVGDLAHFPAERYCGSPNAVSVLAEQAVRGVSLSGLLGALNAQSPTNVRYSPTGSSELELTFSSDAERVCITFDRDPSYNGEPGGAVLNVPGSVQIHSADGRLDGEFSVDLSAESYAGELRYEASGGELSQDPARAAQLGKAYGVQDEVNVSTYDGASVRFESHSFAGSEGGELILNGLEVPECISNPAPIDPGANGAPGCRGIDQISLWSASWGTAE